MALNSLSPTYQQWNLCQILKKPDWTDALSNLFPPVISINYNHFAFTGFIFINTSSNKPKKEKNKCLHIWASFHRLNEIKEAYLKRDTIYSPHTQHLCQNLGGTADSHWLRSTSCVDSRLSTRLCSSLGSWFLAHSPSLSHGSKLLTNFSISHAEWKIYWVMAISIVLWSQGPKEDIR